MSKQAEALAEMLREFVDSDVPLERQFDSAIVIKVVENARRALRDAEKCLAERRQSGAFKPLGSSPYGSCVYRSGAWSDDGHTQEVVSAFDDRSVCVQRYHSDGSTSRHMTAQFARALAAELIAAADAAQQEEAA